MKQTIRKGIITCMLLLSLVSIGFFVFVLCHPGAPMPEPPFPKSDVWICEELGIALDLNKGIAVFDDGEDQVQSSILRERGSYSVSILCDEFDNHKYPFSYCFFKGDFLRADEDIIYLEENASKTIYTFYRVKE